MTISFEIEAQNLHRGLVVAPYVPAYQNIDVKFILIVIVCNPSDHSFFLLTRTYENKKNLKSASQNLSVITHKLVLRNTLVLGSWLFPPADALHPVIGKISVSIATP